MSDDVAVRIVGVSKSFKLPHEKVGSVKGALLGWHKRRRGYEIQHVLKDVSFEIKKGEFFGIVGRNGSGKSTLLKLISQIYTPDKGHVQVNGKLTPFIELGVGFNPELSGRDNVYLNGALLGFSHTEMDAMYKDIVEFAELERFMDQKLKNYSSGMQVRLAFSIAIRANSDILLLDEVLAVGDEAFQRKCSEYFINAKKSKKTIILVTHDMNAVRKYCDRALLLDNGKVSACGDPEDVANQYTLNSFAGNGQGGDGYHEGLSSLVPKFEIVPLSSQVLKSDQDFRFELRYKITQDIPVRFGISIIDEKSGGSASIIDDQLRGPNGELRLSSTSKGEYSFKYKLPLKLFNNRDFYVKASLFKIEGDKSEIVAYIPDEKVCRFAVRGGEYDGGLLRQKGEWL